MEIFHGSYTEVVVPKIIRGRYTKDFGYGFYCTEIREQAVRWAKRFDTPIVNKYRYIRPESLDIKVFDQMTDEWLDFIAACRHGESHSFDIVEGPMADDQIYNYVADFLDGTIDRSQFWVLAKFKHPTHQIAFCSDAALQCIHFISSRIE